MSAVIEFGFNATPVFTGVDRLEQSFRGLDRSVARTGQSMMRGLQTSAGSATRSLGQVSLQVQDIAVQLSSGTKVATVIAQQGSQIASAFGPGGAIVGGVVALGGAFFVARDRALASFATMREESAKLDQTLRITLIEGGVKELGQAFDTVRAQAASVSTELDNMTFGGSGMGFSALWSKLTLGDRYDEKKQQLNNELIKRSTDLVRIEQQTLANSQRNVQLTELRAQGKNDEADALERQIRLEAELARIQGLSLSSGAKAQLSADAVAASQLSGIKPVDPTQEKRTREEITRLQEKFKDDTIETLDPVEKYLALSKQQEAIFESMTEKGGLFYEQSIAGLEAWSAALENMGKSEEQLKVLNMLEQARTLESQKRTASEEVARQREQRDREADSKREEAKREQERKMDEMQRAVKEQAARDEARKQLQEDVAIAKAKQDGDMEKAAKLQQQADFRRKTAEIMEATGLNKSQASAAAWSLVGDSTAPGKSKIKSRLMGGPDQGPLSERRPGGMTAHLMGGHLSDYEALQLGSKGTLGGLLGPSAVGMSQAANLANATRADAGASTPTDGISKLVSAFKSEFGPDFAKQLVDALLAK